MTTRLEKSVILPLSREDEEAVTQMLVRAVAQGYTIHESESTHEGWTWRTFVFEREEPARHISEPIGKILHSGVVQHAKHPTGRAA